MFLNSSNKRAYAYLRNLDYYRSCFRKLWEYLKKLCSGILYKYLHTAAAFYGGEWAKPFEMSRKSVLADRRIVNSPISFAYGSVSV